MTRSHIKKYIYIATLKTPSGIPAATAECKANALVNQLSSVFTKEDLENVPDLPRKFPRYAQYFFWPRRSGNIVPQYKLIQIRRA